MEYNQTPQDYMSYGQSINNQGYQSASALSMRLDTRSVVDEFDIYLRGIQVKTIQDESGNIVNKTIWKGKPIVNELGYQAIMQLLSVIVNSQVVQGNFTDEEMYEEYICRTRKDLATDLMINRKRYGLDTKDFPGIMSRTMRIIEIFMTRPIFNKERDSYASSLRVSESLQTAPRNDGWNIPFLGGKKR